MARAKQRRNIRLKPPENLLRANAQAQAIVRRRELRGKFSGTRWDDILERTDLELAQYYKPVEPEERLREELDGRI